MQVNNNRATRIIVLLLLLSLSGCTPRPPLIKIATAHSETDVQKNCSGVKGKIYLIASSSQYDEKVIPEIEKAFSHLCYSIDQSYLDQNPTRLGYVNTDEKRAETLTDALSSPDVHYLWFIRGGSGALNLYPTLHSNRERISSSTPKIIIGFSDVTAIHSFVNHELNWPSVHGVVAAYNKDMNGIDKNNTLNLNSSLDEVFAALSHGTNYSGIEPLNAQAVKTITGKLDGGNLTLVQSLFSTKYEDTYTDKIMMLEDTGVTPKQLDRTLHQIEYSKIFHPRAVVFGQFYSQNANNAEKKLYKEVIQHFAVQVNYPVYYYPKFGHGKTNRPFLLNQKAGISCNKTQQLCTLNQLPLKTS
ncbi:LD-carboxypeptidase [Escherichia coli]|uniref:LD-carboxypeptidase n=1 Tax=Escherichia coli TaxID=562 RepID=UPI00207D49C2|nr:LD-carboxypeptidase [Escherichia coli]